jgi:hypothetical protein
MLITVARVFWSYVTADSAHAIQGQAAISDYSVLTQAGFLKGLGALFGGLIGGCGCSIALTALSYSRGNPYGIAGGAIVIAAMLIGIPAKIDFMDPISSAVLKTFIISMVIKNFGIVFMGVGLMTEALKQTELIGPRLRHAHDPGQVAGAQKRADV